MLPASLGLITQRWTASNCFTNPCQTDVTQSRRKTMMLNSRHPMTNSLMRHPKEQQAKSCRRCFSTEVTFIALTNNILRSYCSNRSHRVVFYTSASCQEEAGVNSPRTAWCNPDLRADSCCVFSTPSTGKDVRQVIYESRSAFKFHFFYFVTWLWSCCAFPF